MRTITKRIQYSSRKDVFRIIPLGDVHLGNLACDEKLFGATVKDIAESQNTYWIGMGDYCEFINRKDRRFDPEQLPSWLWGVGDLAKAQRKKLIDILKPIKGKCLALIEGNHERDIYHYWERDVYATLAEKMGQAGNPLMLNFSGFLRLVFQNGPEIRRSHAWTLTFFLTHGWWAGRLYGNGALNLERVYGWVDADIVLAGHDHKRRAFGISKLRSMKSGKVERVDGFCCSCGSFLDMPEYGVEKGYRALPIGPLEIIIKPDKHEIRVLQ